MKSKLVAFLIVAAFLLWTTVPLAFAANQPRSQVALKSLEQAKTELKKGTQDKAGHRVKAIKLIDQAISEVKQGIAYDKAHAGKPKTK